MSVSKIYWRFLVLAELKIHSASRYHDYWMLESLEGEEQSHLLCYIRALAGQINNVRCIR
ncbi:hypothetical protein HanPSC8_Chr06g0231591 [Helianthus annuus]|nr:hypothetical protein HanPSC8_Chr06g0231591 [Helianthus annuus]